MIISSDYLMVPNGLFCKVINYYQQRYINCHYAVILDWFIEFVVKVKNRGPIIGQTPPTA